MELVYKKGTLHQKILQSELHQNVGHGGIGGWGGKAMQTFKSKKEILNSNSFSL